MPSVAGNRWIWSAVLLVLVAVSLALATPYIASTRLVRDRIASELSAWSGYKVEIGSPPQIAIWPRLSAVLDDVTFSEWGRPGTKPVAVVDRLEVELSALAALRGEAEFTSAKFVRPTLTTRNTAEAAPMLPSGRLRSAIQETRSLLTRMREETARNQLPGDAFGRISVEDGRILVDGARAPLLTHVDGTLEWPSLNQSATVRANLVWNGETFRLEASSAAPLLLLAGATAPLSLGVEAPLAKASFAGKAKLAGPAYLQGATTLSTDAFGRLADWSGVDISRIDRVKSVSLSGDLSGSLDRMKLTGVTVQINAAKASGALDLAVGAGDISIAGSLAFDRLAFDQIIPPLVEFSQADRTRPAGEESVPARPSLDLRLSATEASLGQLAISDVAATLKVGRDMLAFNILDAAALDGGLQADLRLGNGSSASPSRLGISMTDIDGKALASVIGVNTFVPESRGSTSLDLTGAARTLDNLILSGEGTLSADFRPGKLSNFDLTTFLDRAKKGGFFPLAEHSSRSVNTDGVVMTATISRGVARIQKAEALIEGKRLWLSGIASYPDKGLALTGNIEPAPTAGSQRPVALEASFFVGGSWSAPFISPIGQAAGGD